MNFFLLVVALATPVDAPKADLPTAAAASAAVAVVPVAQPVALDSAAVPSVTELPEAALSAVCGECQPVELDAAVAAPEARPGRIAVFPEPVARSGCALVDLFKGDFLTGPWGAAWRLEAARKRGDSAAARNLEATLDALVTEAVGDGEQ